MDRLAGIGLAAILVAGCGGLFDDQTGLACQHPPREVENADQRDPFGPGEAFEGLDVTTMTPDEVEATALAAGIELTWRLSYEIGQPGGAVSGGYSECWCVPPPAGRVSDLAFDSGGRLVVFVWSGQTVPQQRPQPRMGWGCDVAV